MIIRILCYLLFLVIAAWLGLQLSQMPGYILIGYGNMNIETSLWLGLLVVIALFIALYLVLAILKGLWRTAANCGSWLGTTSEHKKLELAVAAITSATYGDWASAEKALQKYAASHDLIGLVSLSYVRSKHDLKGSIAELDRLYLKNPRYNKFILLIKAHIYLSHHRYIDAVHTIECLDSKERNTNYFNYILIKCYYQLRNYTNIKDLLPKCNKLLPVNEYHEISLHYYKDQLGSETDNIRTIWKKTPEQFKQEPECLLLYVKILSEKGEKANAQKLLVKYIPYIWNEALLEEYIKLTPKPEAITQLTRWHEQNKQEPSLLIALASLHLEHPSLATSFYQKALTITEDNSTLLKLISYYLEINNITEAKKLIKVITKRL